jgi:hypothetical protein
MNITYQIEKYADVIEEMEPLVLAHHIEEDPRANGDELVVNWDMYTALEEVGSFILATVRVDDELVGYLSFIISETPHMEGVLQAASDALFIDKHHRGNSLATTLITTIEEALLESNVKWMAMAMPASEKSDIFMDRLSYTKTDVIYMKELGE